MKRTTFKEVLNFAIKREEEAIKSYGTMIEKAKTPGLVSLLKELQEEEKNHKKLLEEITKEKVMASENEEVIDLKISDYLLEEPAHESMTFQDLLILAAKKEQKAVEIYSKMRRKARGKELRKLLDFLVSQEKSHKLKLEKEYEREVLDKEY